MRLQNAITSLVHKKENKFILIGSEPFFKDYFLSLVSRVYDNIVVYCDEVEALSILGSEFLFEQPFVILKNFDKMNTGLFEDCIKTHTSGLILVLSEKANLKSRQLSKIISIVQPVECYKLKEYEYPLWIKTNIIESGYSCSDNADQLIYKKIGPDLYKIYNELKKLYLIKDLDKIINDEDIEKYVSDTYLSTSFEIFEHLLRKDVVNAFKSFESFSRNKDNFIDIVAFLSVYFEKMYKILLLKEKGLEIEGISDIVGIPAFILKTKYMNRVQNFGKGNISSKLVDLCKLDVDLRLFKGDKKILLEKFILGFKEW